MKKMLKVLVVFSLIAAVSCLLPACGTEEVQEGQLPVLKVGDTWTWSYVLNGTDYTLTETVTGIETVEGRECYVIDMSFDPAMSSVYDSTVYTVTKMTYWADKVSGLIGDKMEMEVTGDGLTYTTTETYVYDPWIELFPLEIGKVVQASLTTTQYMDSHAGEPVVTTEKYVVEGKEQVTVVAGTLSCWKMIIYDGEDNVMVTMWYSDEAKSSVKMTTVDGVAMELKSYSID